MRARFLLVGTLVGTLVMFIWQTISNAALPWHMMTMRQFANDSATAHAIRAAAPQNGMYWSARGVLAAVAITPDFADKTAAAALGPMMARQVVIDLVVTLALALLVLRLPAENKMTTATACALAAVAVGGVMQFSDWNWYGFGGAYALVNVVDQAISFFLVGLTLAAIRQRFGEPTVRTAERPGVRAQGAFPPSQSGTRV